MATLELSVKSNAVSELGKINRQFDSTSIKAEKLKKQFSTLATPVSNKWLTYLGISEIGRQVSSLTSSLASGAAAIVTAFTGINSTIEQTIVMLENATGSAESGKEAFAYIVDLAQKAPYSIAVLTDSFVKLRTAGIQDTERVLESLVDSVAAFGGTDEQLKLVTIAMQQMAGKGVISMEELRRQFAEQVPTAIRAMASELDMSILEMTKKIAKGQLSSDLGIPALVEGLEKLHTGSAAKRMETFQGSIAHARNEWILLLKDIGDGNGSFKSISNMINSVANSMKEFRASAEGMAIIDELSQKIADSMKKIAENPEMVYQFFVEIGQYASMAGSALGGLVEIINNVISAYDLMKGATSFTDWGQGVIDTKDFDMSKYALVRSELLEITKLQQQIDQMKPDILPDNPFNMISQAQKIKDMFSDLGNPDFMKKYEFEFDEAKVQARIDELKRSIEDKLSGNKPKIDVDTSKAEMSLSKLLKMDPSNEFAKVSTTMGNVADSFSIAI
ncbi:MAG: tape measure protein, partial [Desulfatirhabdiaceae bacterium]